MRDETRVDVRGDAAFSPGAEVGRVSVTFGEPVVPGHDDDYDSLIARVERMVRHLAGPKGIAVEPAGHTRSEGPTYWY